MSHWFRRTVMMSAAVVAVAASGVVPAHAGGPTSVLLSAPSVPKVVAAGYEDANYAKLQGLLDNSSNDKPSAGEDHQSGNFVRATWLIHDMMVWRLDIIYPDAPGGPWIATTQDVTGSGKLAEQPVWHRATDSIQLTKLLDMLGLIGNDDNFFGGGGPTSMPQSDPSAQVETPAPQPVDQAAATVKAEQGALSGWRWMIPGFALGAVAAWLAVRLIPKRRPWELVDVE
jgi:hypothetical protein